MKNISIKIGVISLLLTACSAEKPEDPPQVIRPVEFYTVTSSSSLYTQNFPALVEPSDESSLSFRVSGELIEVNVVAGSKVNKTDVIARIDPTDFQIKVNETQAAYDLTAKTFDRQKRMLALELTSQADYDLSFAEMSLAKTHLDTAKNNLKYTVLKAPFSGTISTVNFENREVIAASKTMVGLHASDGIDITFQLPESILSRIKVTNARQYEPSITFTSSPTHQNQIYKAHFKEMNHTPDPKSRTYHVVMTMDKPKGINIVPGMTANVLVELDQVLEGLERYSLVPIESVFSPAGTDPNTKQYAVWKIDEDTMTVHLQHVTIGGVTDQGVKILKGLNEGEIVVAAGVHALLENTKVKEWQKQRGI